MGSASGDRLLEYVGRCTPHRIVQAFEGLFDRPASGLAARTLQ
ncbi:hypothetical protein [Microcoleus sp. ARI1-A2]